MNSEETLFATARREMVETQLRARGITDPRVLAAMGQVPREEFVPDALRASAYEDRPLSIGRGQTISQPYTVALMCEALQLEDSEKVLEVGAGCGYSAAVLSQLASTVDTIERIPELAAAARERLWRLGCHNVRVHVGDGSLGLPECAPYDAIVVTAAAEVLPPAFQSQLTSHGRIVVPLGDSASQTMFRLTKLGDQLVSEELGAFRFVPLIGQFGHREET